MTLSRRNFLADASMLGLMSALLPELAAAQSESSQMAAEDLPHDSYGFWNGFFDSVNPSSSNYGNKAATRGPEDQLPDPAAQTQYLHYDNGRKRLRYASDIQKEELLDHDGDVSVNIALAQFRPANGELSQHPAQFRYAQEDFTLLDDRFGTLADFREMVDEAHRLGMYVIVDIVVNHMANLFYFEGHPNGGAPFHMHDGEYNLIPAIRTGPTRTLKWIIRSSRRATTVKCTGTTGFQKPSLAAARFGTVIFTTTANRTITTILAKPPGKDLRDHG